MREHICPDEFRTKVAPALTLPPPPHPPGLVITPHERHYPLLRGQLPRATIPASHTNSADGHHTLQDLLQKLYHQGRPTRRSLPTHPSTFPPPFHPSTPPGHSPSPPFHSSITLPPFSIRPIHPPPFHPCSTFPPMLPPSTHPSPFHAVLHPSTQPPYHLSPPPQEFLAEVHNNRPSFTSSPYWPVSHILTFLVSCNHQVAGSRSPSPALAARKCNTTAYRQQLDRGIRRSHSN